jgi:hypothetical protein
MAESLTDTNKSHEELGLGLSSEYQILKLKNLEINDDLDEFDLNDSLEVTLEQKDKAASIETYKKEMENISIGKKPIRSSEENRKQLKAKLRNKKNGRATGSTPMPTAVAELLNNPELKKFLGNANQGEGVPDMKKMIKSLSKTSGANHGAKVDTSGVERLLKQMSQ